MLEMINVDFDYADKPILNAVSFSLSRGCLLHLRGNNGAGKTTLLKLLAGLLHPTRGDIQYQGQSITKNRSTYQQHICYVGHKPGVSQVLTVREHCRFELHRAPDSPSLDVLLRRFSLLDFGDVPCNLLSAGLLRRVGLLRLFMSNAPLWLLDEPLVALDQDALDMMMICIKEHLKNGGQIVLTSHQPLPLRGENCQVYCL